MLCNNELQLSEYLFNPLLNFLNGHFVSSFERICGVKVHYYSHLLTLLFVRTKPLKLCVQYDDPKNSSNFEFQKTKRNWYSDVWCKIFEK